jgi:hypothetical protein
MTKISWLNALLAILYISVVASVLYSGTIFKIGMNSVMAPIALISLFTFSAAMMSYLFLYQPFVLYFEGKKKIALDLFLKTLLIFGGITLIIFVLLFLGVFR